MHIGLAADGHLKNKDLLMGRLWGFILATSDAHLPNFLQCTLLANLTNLIYQPLLDMLGSWNLAQTLTRLT